MRKPKPKQKQKIVVTRSTLAWGLAFGIAFGFLLQKGGVTKYDVIVGQLLLTDFTVIKIILTAVLTGMLGIYFMKSKGWVTLYPKSGSVGKNVIGGLIFGVGFALLGYCPGTIAGDRQRLPGCADRRFDRHLDWHGIVCCSIPQSALPLPGKGRLRSDYLPRSCSGSMTGW